MKKKTLARSSSGDVETALPDMCENEVVLEVKKNKKHRDLKRKHDETALETEAELVQDVSLPPVKKRRKTGEENGHGPKPSDDTDENQLSVEHKKHKVKESLVCNEVVENDTKTIDPKHRKNSQYVPRSPAAKAAYRLLDRMSEVLETAATDHHAHFKKTLADFDWHQVCFDSYTAEDCKQFWAKISKRIRKFRTLAELVNDAKNMKNLSIRDDARGKSGVPKRPTSALFLFYRKKLKSFIRKHPGMSNSKALQILAAKFTKMSSSKKQKYLDQYYEAKKLYDQEMAKYRADHPRTSQTSSMSSRPMNAARFYVEQKCREKLSQADGKGDEQKLKKRYRRRWESLSDEQKLEFINTAIQVNAGGDSATKPRIVLSKSEQLLKDKAEGKLPKPPMNGYMMFLKKFCSSTDADGKKCRNADAHEAWIKLSDKKREHYKKKAKKAQEEYMKQNPHEQQVDRSRQKMPKRRRRQLFDGEPVKPLSAYSMYTQSKMNELDKTMSQRERLIEAGHTWSQLSAEEKQYWQNKAVKAQRKYEKALERFKQSSKAGDKSKKTGDESNEAGDKTLRKHRVGVWFDGEPKKPLTAYALFVQAKMTEIDKSLPQRERLREASRLWLTADKQYWKDKSSEEKCIYQRDLELFKQTLTQEQLAAYEQIRKRKAKKKPSNC